MDPELPEPARRRLEMREDVPASPATAGRSSVARSSGHLDPVVERLGERVLPHPILACEVGDGACHPQDAEECPRTEVQALARQREQAPGGGRRSRAAPESRGRSAPRCRCPGAIAWRRSRAASTRLPHGGRGLLVFAVEDVPIFLARHRDDEVDPVLDRPAQPALVRVQLAGLAAEHPRASPRCPHGQGLEAPMSMKSAGYVTAARARAP